MKTKILCTCPPMIRKIDQFLDLFSAQNADIFCPEFQQVLSEEELIELVPQFDGWIIGDDPATERVLAAGCQGRLRACVKWGAGIDNVDFDAAKKLNLPITNTPGTFGEEVSDVAMGYLIGLARQLFQINDGVKLNEWRKPAGMSLSGKKAGVVGLGFVGQCLCRKLAAFGIEILGYDPFVDPDKVPKAKIAPWPEKIEELDFLILCCALTPENKHLVNRKILEQLKPSSYIINVARGPVIDEEALSEALEEDQIAGAALEVMEVEPLPKDSALRAFPQVVFGSHNSSNTLEGVIRTSEIAIRKLFEFLKQTV